MNNYKEEFKTVNLLLDSNFETRAIDAFAISMIKVERQIRRIFTFLIYQNESYKIGDSVILRNVLFKNKNLYFRHFINGIDKCYYKSVKQIYGEGYSKDLNVIEEITRDRNKIFHGQLTCKKLSRDDLVRRINSMKKWCERMAEGFSSEIGYDGFLRNAYRKASNKLNLINTDSFDTPEKYADFLRSLID